ncbi:MAG: hypothetical protein JWP45_2905 [Mucilaginibacter sp.]|nr:hypothetical protein [Mucilaginibacter sp.]
MAQDQNKDTVLTSVTAKALTTTPANGKGNDRQMFPVFLSAFINLLQTDGKNDLVINPTLYSIFGKDGKLQKIDQYRKSTLLRNISVTAGITPDSKNQLHVDDGLWGLKWIIVNNKVLKDKDYQDAVEIARMTGKVQEYVRKLPGGPELYHKYHMQTDTVNNLLSTKDKGEQQIVKDVAEHFNISEKDAANDINGSFAIMGYLLDKLATKPALNFSYNQTYDFQKWQAAKIALSSDFTFYLGKVPFDLTGTVTFAADTTKSHSQLVRSLYEADFGKNITFTDTKWFEIKPGLSFTHIDGPLYKKEKTDSFAASVTPRFQINKNFWLPLTIKYDPKGWFGFLTVQYALK